MTLFGQIKIGELSYDPEEGLKLKYEHMFPGRPDAEMLFNQDFTHGTAPDQFTIKAHGGGEQVPIIGGKVNTWSDGYGLDYISFGEHPLKNSILSSDNSHKELEKHRDKINKVLSFACNYEGTCSPETYEALLNKELQHVDMVPPGKYGLHTAPFSNYLTWLTSKISPIDDSALHSYEKKDGKWQDTGLYKTHVDKGVDIAAPFAVGGAGLYGAYSLLPKKKKTNSKESTHV